MIRSGQLITNSSYWKCTTLAPHLHHTCTTLAPHLHHTCTTLAHTCTTLAPHLHTLAPCTTLAPHLLQVYPEGVQESRPGPHSPPPPQRSWGPWTFQDLQEQSTPRLFTTHLQAPALPASLFSVGSSSGSGNNDAAHGRLIVVARNPKDALCSLVSPLPQPSAPALYLTAWC